MVFQKKQDLERNQIDLMGPEGNAFCLLGIARENFKRSGFTDEFIADAMTEMTSGDYYHLLNTFDMYLHDTFTLLIDDEHWDEYMAKMEEAKSKHN